MIRARSIAVLTLGALIFGLITAGAPTAKAATLVPISGAGSTWSANAIDQWRRNVNQFGLRVNFQSTGSSDGRNQFKNGTVDYAVSEIPYGLTDNGVQDPPPARGYAYMPIVAGGTAFMYNLKVAGKRVTTLRLSGENITKIFTGVITRWDDPAIKADNPGLALPARPVVPVVRSDGSGTSAQFTLWMSKQHAALWSAYCTKMGRAADCGQTSSYPSKAPFLALAGSLGVSGYVSQDKNEGTITYVEESYALNTGFPVVKLLNQAGYYVEPNANNVAVALTGAQINADLTQKLDEVYNNGDKRAYPLSSYSYMIVPTKIEAPINENKGYTLSKFAAYFLCEGQQSAPQLGYSPLPRNLVQAGLDVVRKIPGHDAAGLDINKCKNPTFGPGGANLLAKNAPMPPECDRKGGPVQCTTATGGSKTETPNTNTNTGGGAVNPNPGSGGAPTGGAVVPTPVPGAVPNTAGGGLTPTLIPGTTTDPLTGQPLPATNTATNGDPAAAVPSALGGGTGGGFSTVLVFLAGMLFCGLAIGPPLAARRLAAQRGEQP
jgi:phosphate ABC transporter phosphate-binding protein